MNIDDIIKTARRDSRCVSGAETRALCEEIERLREGFVTVSSIFGMAASEGQDVLGEVIGFATRQVDEIQRLRKLIHGAHELLAIVLDDLKEVEAAAGEGGGCT